jgi:predicted patatin/cPLA2 family phospholipase
MKKVLVMSGGGCKGALTLQGLKSIEATVGKLYQHYDLMCGSSVGAINAGILASGKMSAHELSAIYPNMIKEVFTRLPFWQIPKYSRTPFIKIFNHFVGEGFKMKDCKTKLQITSVDLTTGENHFFKSWEEKDGEELLLDVILRSFAAPFYFGALDDEKNKKVWMDGGMGNCNLPIDHAFIEAWDLLDWDEIQMDVFGAGYTNDTISFEEAKKYKTLKQLKAYMDPLDGGLARSQARLEQVKKMKIIAENQPNIAFNYWDVEIPMKLDTLDGVEYLDAYEKYGQQMAVKPLISIPLKKVTDNGYSKT